jgi:hypothetical protein
MTKIARFWPPELNLTHCNLSHKQQNENVWGVQSDARAGGPKMACHDVGATAPSKPAVFLAADGGLPHNGPRSWL